MTILAHLSDLHFGQESSQLVAGLLHSLDEIRPELVAISGDLTQRARTKEFLAARTFLDRLRHPFLVISGNHDIPVYNLTERFLNPWKRWHRYLGLPLEPRMHKKRYTVMGVNTTRRSTSLIDWSRGRINHDQARAIAAYFAKGEQDRKLRVLVIHHPFWLPEKYRHRHLIGGKETALGMMKEAGVDLILGGHIHVAYTRILKGMILSHAGTAISNRLREGCRNSFKIIRGDRKELTVEIWEYNGSRFVVTGHQNFNRVQEQWMENDQSLQSG